MRAQALSVVVVEASSEACPESSGGGTKFDTIPFERNKSSVDMLGSNDMFLYNAFPLLRSLHRPFVHALTTPPNRRVYFL